MSTVAPAGTHHCHRKNQADRGGQQAEPVIMQLVADLRAEQSHDDECAAAWGNPKSNSHDMRSVAEAERARP
jgi:hypothetical protein